MPTLTDDNVEDFYAALRDGEVVLEKDLVSSFPQVHSDCPWGSYFVIVYRIEFEGEAWFVALEEGCEYSPDLNSCLAFSPTLDQSLEVVDAIEMAWCKKWACGC